MVIRDAVAPTPAQFAAFERFMRQIHTHLQDMGHLMKPGVRMAFVAYHPDVPNNEYAFFLHDDPIDKVIAVMQDLQPFEDDDVGAPLLSGYTNVGLR
jgi:hypothetical protein